MKALGVAESRLGANHVFDAQLLAVVGSSLNFVVGLVWLDAMRAGAAETQRLECVAEIVSFPIQEARLFDFFIADDGDAFQGAVEILGEFVFHRIELNSDRESEGIGKEILRATGHECGPCDGSRGRLEKLSSQNGFHRRVILLLWIRPTIVPFEREADRQSGSPRARRPIPSIESGA